ncbi:MAG: hypothetical protein U0X89_06035 [Bacteroidia bacterium]
MIHKIDARCAGAASYFHRRYVLSLLYSSATLKRSSLAFTKGLTSSSVILTTIPELAKTLFLLEGLSH